MGRNVNRVNLMNIIEAIRESDGLVRMNDISKRLKLHPQTVCRLLPLIGKETEELLIEDDKGFLGIFKRRR